MNTPEEHLAMLESAALESETRELIAEKCFDDRHAAAERDGSLDSVTASPEFREWMAARAVTDSAWGRWAEFMHRAG
jgi:hypothetical protein